MKEDQSTVGALMLDLEGTALTMAECELLNRPSVGGVILFKRNYISPSQLTDLTASIRECKPDILIAVDQEGGRVQRFYEGFLSLPALYSIGQLYARDADRGRVVAEHCAWAMAAEVIHHGVDISFAPVLDLYNSESRAIENRAFSPSAEDTVDLAESYISGMNKAGMVAIGKHYPGHGSVEADSHEELPRDEREADEIMGADYKVFAKCVSRLGGIMSAHVIYPAVDGEPAGFSNFWLNDKLRTELGFQGAVFSDDLSMTAVKSAGTAEYRAKLALTAGCDMVLVCNDRASALSVSDWLERNEIQGSRKLHKLRAKPAPEIANLYNEEKWLTACEMVCSLTKI